MLLDMHLEKAWFTWTSLILRKEVEKVRSLRSSQDAMASRKRLRESRDEK